ncbi:MAG: 50S ribosomal protein L6 [Candidatus Aenigmatarchaeota archaeon]
MKKGVKIIEKELEIPSGIDVVIGEGYFTVKGPKGELRRDFPSYVKASMKDGKVTFSVEGDRKKTSIAGTMKSHLSNMIHGVTHGYEGRMRFVHSHFPMKVSVDGKNLVVQNFLGERSTRKIPCAGDIKMKVDKDEVIVTGIDKESVGQAIANIEQKTKVRGFDRRVFQDGIYIIQKPVPSKEKS